MAMVSVYIPTPFRSFVGNRTNVEVQARDVAEVIANLDARFPGFRDLCCEADGSIPAHINIYVNNREISTLDGPQTRLAGNQVYVSAEGGNVGEVLGDLGSRYPGLRHMIFDESDEVPGHINI